MTQPKRLAESKSRVSKRIKRIFLIILLVFFVCISILIYKMTYWIQMTVPDDVYLINPPNLFSEDNGDPTGNGGWRFTFYGYQRFTLKKFIFRSALPKLIKEMYSARTFNPVNPIVGLYHRWKNSQELLVRDTQDPIYKLTLEQEKLTYMPGEVIRIKGKVQLSPDALRILRRYKWRPSFAFAADRVFDQKGIYHSPLQTGMGSFLTPTGMPIEFTSYSLRNSLIGSPYKSPIEGLIDLESGLGADTREGLYPIDIQVSIPSDSPVGLFRMSFEVGLFDGNGWVKAENWNDLDTVLQGRYANFADITRNKTWLLQGPLFSIGATPPPKMIWTLCNNIYSYQSRGIVADEDQQNFSLNLTGIHQGNFVVPPFDKQRKLIQYDLSPFFPTQKWGFGQEPDLLDSSSALAYYPVLPLRPGTGHWRLHIIGPENEIVADEEGDFDEVTDYRGNSSRLIRTFPKFGKYTVTLTGWVQDIYGHRLSGGGKYTIFSALPLSFSSSFKPGQSYSVGQQFNPRIHVFPPGLTKVRYAIQYFPESDEQRAITWTHEGVSNAFGYYYPARNEIPPFDEPGEYKVDVEASQWTENGVLRYHHFRQAGIVYDPKTVLDLQRFQLFPTLCSGIQEPEAKNSFIAKTGRVPGGCLCTSFSTYSLPDEQSDISLLSDSEGGNSYVFYPLTWKQGSDLGFSPSPWSRRNTSPSYKSCLRPGCFWDSIYGVGYRPPLASWYSGYPEAFVYFDTEHPDPVVSFTDNGYHPALYPENIKVKSYCYLSAFRPGIVLKHTVFEENHSDPFWAVTPERSAGSLNSRLQGDVVNDHYRIIGGCVRKEYDTGRTFYGNYVNVLAISPRDSNLNGYFANGSQPIAEVAGEKVYRLFGHSPEPGTIFAKKNEVAISGFVAPTTADLPVEFSLQLPDGKTEQRNAVTDRYGGFGMPPISSGTKAGFVWARIAAPGPDGKETRVLGTADNRYLMFIAADRHRKIALNLKVGQSFAAHERINILGQAPAELVDGKVGYVRLTPGVLLDQDIIPLDQNGVFRVSFNFAQDTVKSKLFRDRSTKESLETIEPERADTDGNVQMATLFIDGRGQNGEEVTASAYLMFQGNRLVSVDAAPMTDGNSPRWLFDEGLPQIPSISKTAPGIESATDCLLCHRQSEQASWSKQKYTISAWTEIFNWHRAKSYELFWPTREDEAKIRKYFLPSAQEDVRRKQDLALIEAKCGPCHASWKTLRERGIRYTEDGWKRYVDYRYPPLRKTTLPAEKYGWLRRFTPDSCLRDCHSSYPLRLTPAIEPLPDEERTRLVSALSDVLDARTRLPETQEGFLQRGRQAYQDICYNCHSLELKLGERDPRLPQFVPGHLAAKAGMRFDQKSVELICRYLTSLAIKD